TNVRRPAGALCSRLSAALVWTLLLAGPAEAGQPAAAQPPVVLSLERAIALALDRNRDLLIAAEDRSKANAQINEARSSALPSLDLSANYTRNIQIPVLFLPPNSPINPTSSTAEFEIGSNNSYYIGAALSQTLYSRKVRIALDIAETYRDYAQEAYRGTEQAVVLAVKKAFYGALLAGKLVEANRQGLDIVRANFENVQSQYHNGTAAEYDMLRAEVEVANTEPLLISAENNLKLAKNSLKNLLSIPIEQDMELEGDFAFRELPADSMDRARRDAISRNALVRELSLSEAIQQKNIGIERANYFPKLSLIGAYSWQSQDNTFQFKNYNWAQTSSLGLQLSFPLFDGARAHARIQEARGDYEKARLARLKAEEALRIQIESAELRMAEAAKRIKGQEKSIDQARKAVHIAQTRFASGVGTQLELLDSQVALTRAQSTYAQAVYDYLAAQADWQFAVGLPQ
ncbi:MAG TPA: TolC family protein, partial [Candidatus Bathyarchaeia archaeon]|nr:TolC family protein [Candidatus Bathyarchaeia archaeon]